MFANQQMANQCSCDLILLKLAIWLHTMSMRLTGQTMRSISLFKMEDTNAGAIRTVIVDVKYFSSNNVAIHTENCKLEISMDCTLKELEKTIRQKT